MKRLFRLIIVKVLLLLVVLVAGSVSASVSLGIAKGDWIEYNVSIVPVLASGSEVVVPMDHNITWARMEISEIQNGAVSLAVSSSFANGSIISGNMNLDIEAGVLGDDFIIPANLTVGASFFDARQGNITITSVEQATVAGAQRTVISGATNTTTYRWDQSTGVVIFAQTTFPEYAMVTQVNKTNLWIPAALPSESPTDNSFSLFGSDLSTVFALVMGVVAVLVIAVSAFVLRRRAIKSGDSQRYKL